MFDEAHRLTPETVALQAPGDVEAGDPDDTVVCKFQVGIFLGTEVQSDMADGDEDAIAGCARLLPVSGCCVRD